MLSANLAQAQRILKRIVENPTFDQEINKITSLKGTATGKLVLGNSLTNIKAEVDVTDLNLSANYQDLPFPIGVTNGQIVLRKIRSVSKIYMVHWSLGLLRACG